MTSDLELVERCNADRQAFGGLVRRYQSRVYSICLGILRDRASAEDAAQEAFVRCYTSLETFDKSKKFSNWLFKIATNQSLNMLRKKKSGDKMVRKVREMKKKDYSGGEDNSRLLSSVYRAVEKLPPKLAAAMMLFHREGLSIREVAEVMAAPEGTVKTYLHKARRLVRESVGERDA